MTVNASGGDDQVIGTGRAPLLRGPAGQLPLREHRGEDRVHRHPPGVLRIMTRLTDAGVEHRKKGGR
jgi:hypothetical protein